MDLIEGVAPCAATMEISGSALNISPQKIADIGIESSEAFRTSRQGVLCVGSVAVSNESLDRFSQPFIHLALVYIIGKIK